MAGVGGHAPARPGASLSLRAGSRAGIVRCWRLKTAAARAAPRWARAALFRPGPGPVLSAGEVGHNERKVIADRRRRSGSLGLIRALGPNLSAGTQ